MARRAVAVAIVAALAGCSTLRSARPGGASVADPALHAAVARLEPAVTRALGARWPWEYEVRVAPVDRGFLAETRDSDRRVTIALATTTREDLDEVLAHELVHVHAVGRWESLPYGVQEGLACWVAAVAVGRAAEYRGPPPSPEYLRRALTITAAEYLALRGDTAEVDQAATWLASFLAPAR